MSVCLQIAIHAVYNSHTCSVCDLLMLTREASNPYHFAHRGQKAEVNGSDSFFC